MIAVTSGEVKDPDVAVPKALKATVFRLTTFYVLTIGIMLQFGIPQLVFLTIAYFVAKRKKVDVDAPRNTVTDEFKEMQ